MPIAQFNGKALVFNNGVIDVRQGDTSLVDSEKVAHIPQSSVNIDNITIIENAEHELEVPFDNQTIYVDQDGFIKARGGEVNDSKIILCTQVGSDPAGPVGSFTLNQASNKTITIPIPQSGGGSVEVDNDTIINSEGVIEVNGAKFIVKKVTKTSDAGELDLAGTFGWSSLSHAITYTGPISAEEATEIRGFLTPKSDTTGKCKVYITGVLAGGTEEQEYAYNDVSYSIETGGKG